MSTRIRYILRTPQGRAYDAFGVEHNLAVYRNAWKVPKPVGPMTRTQRIIEWFKRVKEMAPIRGQDAAGFTLHVFREPRYMAPFRSAWLHKCEEYGRHVTPARKPRKKRKKKQVAALRPLHELFRDQARNRPAARLEVEPMPEWRP